VITAGPGAYFYWACACPTNILHLRAQCDYAERSFTRNRVRYAVYLGPDYSASALCGTFAWRHDRRPARRAQPCALWCQWCAGSEQHGMTKTPHAEVRAIANHLHNSWLISLPMQERRGCLVFITIWTMLQTSKSSEVRCTTGLWDLLLCVKKKLKGDIQIIGFILALRLKLHFILTFLLDNMNNETFIVGFRGCKWTAVEAYRF